MSSLVQSEAVSCSNQRLVFYAVAAGVLEDLVSLEYIIRKADGTQVWPVSGRAVVDIDNDCPTGGRIAAGVYVAHGYTVDAAAPYERHSITWYYTHATGDAESTRVEYFDVVDAPAGGYGYALPSDLRAEGFTTTMVDDERLVALIDQASMLIEQVTSQWFEPRYMAMTLDGRESHRLDLGIPIVAVAEVAIDGAAVDAGSYRVYNRHLTQRLLNPDDREDPHLRFFQQTDFGLPFPPSTFPTGHQNVTVTGVFGYTDPPGPIGSTPVLLKQACKLLVVKQMALMSDSDARFEERVRNYLIEERTRDQMYRLDPTMVRQQSYSLTGDAEVDQLLVRYMAPLSIGHT
jgi:hypothetical protein